MNNKAEVSRFKRISSEKAAGTSILFGRFDLQEKEEINNDGYLGEFLSKMWTLFGEAELCYEGFIYAFQDIETEVIFTAGLGGFGPSYGGFPEDAEKVKPVLETFEKLLKNVVPMDCEVEIETDFGPLLIGAKNGIPFDRPVME
ncbi:MAG: hypothetical protein AB6733_04095 [Clostridiaceae bacterium]